MVGPNKFLQKFFRMLYTKNELEFVEIHFRWVLSITVMMLASPDPGQPWPGHLGPESWERGLESGVSLTSWSRRALTGGRFHQIPDSGVCRHWSLVPGSSHWSVVSDVTSWWHDAVTCDNHLNTVTHSLVTLGELYLTRQWQVRVNTGILKFKRTVSLQP